MEDMTNSETKDICNAMVSEISNGRKRRLLKKAPDAPKRFKSAYICFVMDKMEEVKKSSSPDAKVLLPTYLLDFSFV
jgi:hypothetical protein